MNFDHFAFQVSDMDSSISFYTEKLGFKLKSRAMDEEDKEEYAFLEHEDARLELIRDLRRDFKKPEIKEPYCPHFCLEVEDMGSSVDLLRKSNIPVVHGPMEIKGDVTWVYFCDPDNNILEYIQQYKKK